MPATLRRTRQAVAAAAVHLTEILVSRSIRQRRGRLRSDLFDSPAVRRRVSALVEHALRYNAGLTAWREKILPRLTRTRPKA
jgi:hypothetical protein